MNLGNSAFHLWILEGSPRTITLSLLAKARTHVSVSSVGVYETEIGTMVLGIFGLTHGLAMMV